MFRKCCITNLKYKKWMLMYMNMKYISCGGNFLWTSICLVSEWSMNFLIWEVSFGKQRCGFHEMCTTNLGCLYIIDMHAQLSHNKSMIRASPIHGSDKLGDMIGPSMAFRWPYAHFPCPIMHFQSHCWNDADIFTLSGVKKRSTLFW